MTIEFTPRPSRGICLSSPDGAYLDVRIDRMQVIVVGPMRHAPVEYLRALCEAFDNDSIELVSAEFMTMKNDDLADQSPEVRAERDRIAMLRGFVSMEFEQHGVLDEQVAVQTTEDTVRDDDLTLSRRRPEDPPLAQSN